MATRARNRYSVEQQTYLNAKAALETVKAQCEAEYPQHSEEELEAMDGETFSSLMSVVDAIDIRHNLHGACVSFATAENALIDWGEMHMEKGARMARISSVELVLTRRVFAAKEQNDVREKLINLIMDLSL